MRKTITSIILLGCIGGGMTGEVAAQTLSLDSCRALALRSNKQLSIARVKKEVATNTRKMARTKYLPHITLAGGYMYSSREISLLSDEQKAMFSNIGTIGMQSIAGKMQNFRGELGEAMTPTDS